MARTAFYFLAAWIFESHFTGAAVTVFKQKNHLGMLRKSFEKISGRWMPDSRRGYFSRDVANGVCAGTQKRFNEKTIQKLESVLEISIPDISNDAEAIIKDMEESQTI